MFNHTDNRIRLAQENYKRYYDKFVRTPLTVTKGEKVYIDNPPTAAKAACEKEEQTARSKLLPKSHVLLAVIEATAETGTIKQDGIPVKIYIDRCTFQPTTNMTPDITDQARITATPTEDEYIFHTGPPMVPVIRPISSAPTLIRLVSQNRNETSATYTGLYTDGTTRSGLTIVDVPTAVVTSYWRTVFDNRQPRQTFRRRGRPTRSQP